MGRMRRKLAAGDVAVALVMTSQMEVVVVAMMYYYWIVLSLISHCQLSYC